MTEEKLEELREVETQLREKDLKVLNLVSKEEDDIQKVTSATNLSNSEVNYCFRKLQEMELIEVSKPDGTVTRVVNRTKQVFEAPKQANPTDLGEKLLQEAVDPEIGRRYDDLTRQELVRKVHRLEEEMEEIKQTFKAFRKQVQDRLQE